MVVKVLYGDGHVERFDSNSLTGGQPFGRASVLTEFHLAWEAEGEGRSLVAYCHHLDDPATSDDDSSADADRIRGPRCKLVDWTEEESVLSISVDGEPFAWRQGGRLVDGQLFELACSLWYSGPSAASASERAVALFGYLERARPDLCGDEERICALFGYPAESYRAAEDAEMRAGIARDQQ